MPNGAALARSNVPSSRSKAMTKAAPMVELYATSIPTTPGNSC